MSSFWVGDPAQNSTRCSYSGAAPVTDDPLLGISLEVEKKAV
jgi:hypothetical protein